MEISKKKFPGHDPVRAQAVKNTVAKFGCTSSYVRIIIADKNTYRDDIRRFYNQEYERLKPIMNYPCP